MAVSTQLVAKISELFGNTTLGIPLSSIETHMRYLREAGLISKTGRGITAARMIPRDAALLLTATAGSPLAKKDSLRAIERPGQFVAREGAWDIGLPIPEVHALPDNHTFLDAIAALIQAGMTGSLQASVDQVLEPDDSRPPLQMAITLKGFQPRAQITIEEVHYDEDGAPRTLAAKTRHYDYPAPKGQGNLERIPQPTFQEAEPDLSYQFTFTQRTIVTISNLLRE